MPLSSPAPFWKYAADFGSTPGRFDNTLFGSPLKSVRPKLEEQTDSRDSTKPAGDSSSSPSGGVQDVGQDSPTRPSTARSRDNLPHIPIERILPPSQSQAGAAPPPAQPSTQLQPAAEIKPVDGAVDARSKLMPPPAMPDEEDEEGDEEEGFDLSKGFQPIGSFHRNMTATVIRGN